jgi:hypothetical protein
MGVRKKIITPQLPDPFPLNTSARGHGGHSFPNPDFGHKHPFAHHARIEFGPIGTLQPLIMFVGEWQPTKRNINLSAKPCQALSRLESEISWRGGKLIRFSLRDSLWTAMPWPVFPLVNEKRLWHDTEEQAPFTTESAGL